MPAPVEGHALPDLIVVDDIPIVLNGKDVIVLARNRTNVSEEGVARLNPGGAPPCAHRVVCGGQLTSWPLPV